VNPKFSNSPEDRLLDELLHEQQHGPDEAYLQKIEAALDASSAPAAKRGNGRAFRRIAIAAGVILTAGAGAWWQHHAANRIALAHETREARVAAERNRAAAELEALETAVREQEEKVEERRKVLATIVRTKGIVYHGKDPATDGVGDDGRLAANDAREEAIKRGLDLQDYVDAKRDFESDQQRLQSMRRRQNEIAASVGRPPAIESNLLAGHDNPRTMPSPPVKPQALDSRTTAFVAGGGFMLPGSEPPADESGDRYGSFIDQPWKSPATDPLSTFSIDVDTASYGNLRRMIREGREVPRDAVRIEECINAFNYRYAQPQGEGAFAVGASIAVCPWEPANQLVRVAIKGREIDPGKRPASNLVFLIDVSGSMQSSDKLPLLKQSMTTLVDQLDERDRVAIVVYAGSEGVALPSTRLDAEGRAAVLATLSKLEAGGSTNGGAGIKRAYEIAMKEKIAGGVNRVILATDGDFNVGVTNRESLVELVKERAGGGVYLTVLGYGSGNLNDAMMDAITRDGNGNYFYIDSEREGRKVFLRNLAGTLVTIAKDVKIQIEFNPAKVGTYRLIGYANRVLRNQDFDNDKIDAGDIGAGHTVTAFYELTPPAASANTLKYQASPERPAVSDEWLTVKLRHKDPEGDESSKVEFPLVGNAVVLDQADPDFQFAAAVALFGMKLRGMEDVRDIGWDKVLTLASPGLADDPAEDRAEDRAEFVELVRKLDGSRSRIIPPPAEVTPPGGN
jgi:Ca-activated chloride channel family protein